MARLGRHDREPSCHALQVRENGEVLRVRHLAEDGGPYLFHLVWPPFRMDDEYTGEDQLQYPPELGALVRIHGPRVLEESFAPEHEAFVRGLESPKQAAALLKKMVAEVAWEEGLPRLKLRRGKFDPLGEKYIDPQDFGYIRELEVLYYNAFLRAHGEEFLEALRQQE